MRTKELTYEERMVWGDCPVCKAPDGQPCHAEVGLHLSIKVDGSRLKTGEGVHLARLRNAPEKVKTVPACMEVTTAREFRGAAGPPAGGDEGAVFGGT